MNTQPTITTVVVPLYLSWFPTRSRHALYMPAVGEADGLTIEKARAVAPRIMAMPPGCRVLLFNGGNYHLFGNPLDLLPGGKTSLWHPNGISIALAQFMAFFGELKRLGVELDIVVLDAEAQPSIYHGNFDADVLRADPRYAEAVRRYDLPENPWSDVPRCVAGMARMIRDESFTIGLVITYYYQGCEWSNWAGSPASKADAPLVPDLNANAIYYDTDDATHASPVCYAEINKLRRKANGRLVGFDAFDADDAVRLTSFQALTWDINKPIAAYRAKAPRVRPWRGSRRIGVLSVAHVIERDIHLLTLTGGPLLDFQGEYPPEEYVTDDAAKDAAGDAYLALRRDAQWVRPIGADHLRKDTLVYLATAAEFRRPDGTTFIAGRVTWADHAALNQSAAVWLGNNLTVRVRRTRGEAGTSF
ncbi:MAG TPA: hypothetical protein VF595_16040 [Tepidisphaeraceae bacterium]|jgi:hypothetical protein